MNLWASFSWSAEYGFCDKILSVQKQKVMCASVHLVSGVHFKCARDFLAYKYTSLVSLC